MGGGGRGCEQWEEGEGDVSSGRREGDVSSGRRVCGGCVGMSEHLQMFTGREYCNCVVCDVQ